MRLAALAAVALLAAAPASAQEPAQADPAPLNLTAQQDHKLMMEALKIDRLRPGAILIDDSYPPAFALDRAIRRAETKGDLLFSNAGIYHPGKDWLDMPPDQFDDTISVNDFLVSDAASLVTCATIDVNGGL